MSDLFGKPQLRPGEGAGKFLADLAEGISDAEMRKRWVAGEYGSPRPDLVREWRKLSGRT